MWAYVTIAIGGVFGCWARYAMTNSVQAVLGRAFPYATLSVLTGFLGGFSTFSTFAMETFLLAEQGEWGRSALYVFLSLLLGLLATFIGVFAARAI
jgi:fluoride exporter